MIEEHDRLAGYEAFGDFPDIPLEIKNRKEYQPDFVRELQTAIIEVANTPYEDKSEQAEVAEAIAISTWALMQTEIVKNVSKSTRFNQYEVEKRVDLGFET